ncbi:uncharacterized protein K444DRAFT_165375 [Hyaloscypha bicolor E]|uniref:Uncharacterized protein n=1 Tax=Hyaloscypha bicolor E TaxID=1095630 RepID=A0A2J6TT24_9HELO|nr:uncharacterized protein K444DRAFT_165375 [Hyaloscypha bicolor E]PMD66179.1 hypothetical protein K444DRAFT_165375 [Hyaloscypha bicolor E]
MDGGFLPHLRRDDPKPPHISTVSVSVSLSSCKPLSSKKQCPEPMEFNCPLLNTKPVSAAATDPRRRAGAHARSCTPVNPSSAPNPPGSNQPSIREPRDCSRAPCCTSKFPGTVHPHLRSTCTPTPFPFLPSLTVPASPYAHAAETFTPSQPLPRTRFLLLIPHSSTHKSLASHATTKSKQIKSKISQGPLPSAPPHFRHPPIIT